MSRVNPLRKEFCLAVANSLEAFTYIPSSKTIERPGAGYKDVIVVDINAKFSPYLRVSFFFGVKFDAISEIREELNEADSLYHIFAWSLNLRKGRDVDDYGLVEWEVNFEEEPLEIVPEVVGAIKEFSFPFFEHYHSLREAHRAIVEDRDEIHPSCNAEHFRLAIEKSSGFKNEI